jgi:hypothetical protein
MLQSFRVLCSIPVRTDDPRISPDNNRHRFPSEAPSTNSQRHETNQTRPGLSRRYPCLSRCAEGAWMQEHGRSQSERLTHSCSAKLKFEQYCFARRNNKSTNSMIRNYTWTKFCASVAGALTAVFNATLPLRRSASVFNLRNHPDIADHSATQRSCHPGHSQR